MLARSGKVSMATKKRSGEEINDRQILCGMGNKLRRLTAGNGDGSYTQILTTGAMSGTLTLMPQLNGVDAAKAPAVVNIISVSSSRTHSSIKIDKDRYLSGNPIEVTVELRDENDKPVKEQKQQLNPEL